MRENNLKVIDIINSLTILEKKYQQSSKENSLKAKVLARLNDCGIKPNERLGQHFLIDQSVVNTMVDLITPGSCVLEIGSGVGQITEAIAKTASKVISIEINQKLKPCLESVVAEHNNIQVIFGDALDYDWKNFLPKRKKGGQHTAVVGNIPYHTTEPLMLKLAATPINEAVLIVGKKFADTISAESETSSDFSKLTVLTQSHFNAGIVTEVSSDQSYPPPRVESAVVQLLPRTREEVIGDRHSFVFQRLFATAGKNPTVVNILKEALIESGTSQIVDLGKRESHRYSRRENRRQLREFTGKYTTSGEDGKQSDTSPTQNLASRSVEALRLPREILNQPFNALDNEQIKILSAALRTR